MLRTISFLAICGLSIVLSIEAFAGDMHPVDLAKYFNEKLDGGYGRLGQGNNLAHLPRGEHKFADVKFNVGDGMMQLGSQRDPKFPIGSTESKSIGPATRFTCCRRRSTAVHRANRTETNVVVPEKEQIGEYIITYSDGSTEGFPIIHGEDVRDWWYVPGEADAPTVGKVAWEGTNEFADGKRRDPGLLPRMEESVSLLRSSSRSTSSDGKPKTTPPRSASPSRSKIATRTAADLIPTRAQGDGPMS